ncbi:MAG: hypothetical protein ACJAYC_003168 [Halieaceae bacterium]|jgi:hypothetical protein
MCATATELDIDTSAEKIVAVSEEVGAVSESQLNGSPKVDPSPPPSHVNAAALPNPDQVESKISVRVYLVHCCMTVFLRL